MNNSRSEHLDIVRSLSMFFVMLLHTSTSESTKEHPIVSILVLLSWGAVPIFFMLSGYLAHSKISDKSVSWFDWTKSKFLTLGVPYLFWNALLLLSVWILKWSGIDILFRGQGAYFDVEPTLTSNLAALLGVGRYPIVYQFWFLRDLIAISILAPLVLRYLPHVPFLPWFFLLIPSQPLHSMGFYLLGYSIKQSAVSLEQASRTSDILYLLLWCGICFLISRFDLDVFLPLIGLGSAAFIYYLSEALVSTKTGKLIAAAAPATFLVYALHDPTQRILGRLMLYFSIPYHDTAFAFLLVPIIVFCLCTVTYFFMRRYVPQFMLLLTGGR